MKWIFITTVIFAVVTICVLDINGNVNWLQVGGIVLAQLFLSVLVMYEGVWREAHAKGKSEGWQEGVDAGYKWGQDDSKDGKNKFIKS